MRTPRKNLLAAGGVVLCLSGWMYYQWQRSPVSEAVNRAIASGAVDCGVSFRRSSASPDAAQDCAVTQFRARKYFVVRDEFPLHDAAIYALVGHPDGTITNTVEGREPPYRSGSFLCRNPKLLRYRNGVERLWCEPGLHPQK